MRTGEGDSPHAGSRVERDAAAAAAAADLRKFLRERFAIQAPCSMDDGRRTHDNSARALK
jgi:hypothetical protein